MAYTISEKILTRHATYGNFVRGEEIGIKIDQTLTQDATGTAVYLQLEAMEIDRVRTELSVAYIDHNTLQAGFENADDHRYIPSFRACISFQQPKWLRMIWVSQSSILSMEMVPGLQPSGPCQGKILQGQFKIPGHAAELPLFPWNI